MEFIPYLEEINMISEIEEWITRVVPEKLHAWQSEGIDVVPISINISPDSFKNRDFIENIAININGVDPSLISLEIVERLFLDNPTYTGEILNTLKSRGFRVYMDDFGTGYPSLSYLSNLPIDCIKIDISFIKKMVKDSNTRAIVKAIILLAKELDIKTIAEGAETEEQLNLLKEFGCDYIQGFLFSKPLPEEEFVKLLKQ